MFDTAADGSASPLFIAGIGLAGMCLGLLADALIRRALPQLAGDASGRLRLRRRQPPLPSRPCWPGASVAQPNFPRTYYWAYSLLFWRGSILRTICCRIGSWAPCLRPALSSWRFAALATGAAGDVLSRSRRVRNLVLFIPDLGIDQQKRPRNGRREARRTTWTVLRLPRLVAALLRRSPGLRGGRPRLRLPDAKNRGNKPKEVAYGPSMLAAGLAIILLLR